MEAERTAFGSFFRHTGNADSGPVRWVRSRPLHVGVANRDNRWLAAKPIICRSTPLSAVLFVAALLATRLLVRRAFPAEHPLAVFAIDLLLAVLFGNLLISMKLNKTLPKPPGKEWNVAFAAFSFSLYCIHTPVINLYVTTLERCFGTGWQMLPDRMLKWVIVLGAIVVSIASAFLFSLATEAHTARLRMWLMNLFHGDTPNKSRILPAPQGR